MVVNFTEVTNQGDCVDSYSLVRTWSATDACGNTTEAIQILTVQDNTPPVLAGIPSDRALACGADEDITLASVTATDNCDTEVEITFVETTEAGTGGCASSEIIVRTWTATDNCGNTCLLYTSPSPRDATLSRMPSSA